MSDLEQPTREIPAAYSPGGDKEQSPLPPPPPPDQNLDRATSVLAGLRVEHNVARGGRTKVFPIPGFKGKLACRYGVISVEEQRTIEQRALDTPATNPYRELNLYADQLITACREFGTMDGGEFVPLDAERPVRWGDPRLLSGLEIDPGTESPTARQAILAVFRHVFGGEDGPWVLSEHHTAVMAWMRPSLDDADGEFAKNS